MNFHELSINTPSGKALNMSDYEGKAVLVVNTATKCGLAPQFDDLERLHQEYKNELVILGFPCDQFGGQEPESNETVVEACRINHGVTFQLTEKIDVNGSNTHPIFEYLKDELDGMLGKGIKWNFTKFLVAPDGKPFKRYAPTTTPNKIEKDIKKLISG